MTRFHMRWAHEDELPRKPPSRKRSKYNVRSLVAGAAPVVLDIDPTAVEILCNVCGESLRGPQRDALLPTLEDLVANPGHAPSGAGPLSQAGELAAIMGLAQFALRSPEPWLFVRIPEAQEPRPDVFAISPGGIPWRLELKGVAKLASQVPQNGRMVTCANVRGQVAKALDQLDPKTPIPLTGGEPQAAFRPGAGLPSFSAQAGGLALSVVVLAEAALLSRSDIRPPNEKGCPTDTACAQHCLKAPHGISQTSIVGLLWTEVQPRTASVVSRGVDPLGAALVALKALDAAAWAGSGVGATESLAGLGERLADPALEVKASDAARVLRAGLQRTRNQVSRETRIAAVEQVLARREFVSGNREGRIGEFADDLLREARTGGLERDAEPVPLEYAFGREHAGEVVQVVVDGEEYGFGGAGLRVAGRLQGRTLRLAPRLAELDRWQRGEMEGGLAERAAAVVTSSLLPRLDMAGIETGARESRRVGVRLLDGSEWIVGREWWSDGSALSVLDRMSLYTREEFGYACWRTLAYGDPWLFRDWLYHHSAELADAGGVSRCDVIEAVERVSTLHRGQLFSGTMAVIDALRNLPDGLPPSRRHLWAALDGTISAVW